MKILQVVFLPLDSPKTGGAIRADQINSKLRELGHKVDVLTIFSSKKGKTKLGASVRVRGGHLMKKLGDLAGAFPYAALNSYFATGLGKSELTRKVRIEKYDVVWEEHPYIHEAIHNLFLSRVKKIPIFVYSAHNFETQLVKAFIKEQNLTCSPFSGFVQKEIERLETQAVIDASFVVGCSQDDLRNFQSIDPKANLLLAANASSITKCSESGESTEIARLGLTHYALFVGSGHLPNHKGFFTLLGDSLQYLSPNFKIVCVGSVSTQIKDYLKNSAYAYSALRKLTLLENVSNSTLNELRCGASAILLPILSGGGTNLKTAEALLSPSKVLGTRFAFRGFDEYINYPGVVIADTPSEFQNQLAQISRLKFHERYHRDKLDIFPLTWEASLRSLEKLELGEG